MPARDIVLIFLQLVVFRSRAGASLRLLRLTVAKHVGNNLHLVGSRLKCKALDTLVMNVPPSSHSVRAQSYETF